MKSKTTKTDGTSRAAIYCRISKDLAGERLGVTRQLEDCTELAERIGWEIVDVYTDNDISATSGKRRPEYRRLLEDIESNRVSAIVAWAPDRLYRRLADLEELIDVIEGHGVAIRTVKAGDLDLTSAHGRMVARLLGVVATGEGEIKAERWKRSWRQGRERGAVARTGSRMFGYTRDGEVIDDEAAIARRMARDVISGVPILGVARWLEAEGVKTTRGTPWRPGTVRQYLNNPRIAGYSTLNGDIVGDGQWEPVLDRDTWETVRAMLTARSRPRAPRASILNGLIFCGACGHRLITSGAKGRRTYRCPKRPGMNGCGSVSGYAEEIEELAEDLARLRLADPRVQGRVRELRSRAGSAELLTEISALEARLLELEAELEVPGVPVAQLLRVGDRTRERLAELQQQLESSAAAHSVSRYTGGSSWPRDLAERRRLVSTALHGYRICLDRPTQPSRLGFDRRRVRLEDVAEESAVS